MLKNSDAENIIRLVTKNRLSFQSTHSKLCYPIILRLYKKMMVGIQFSPIKVDGNVLIDGHHRYIASLMAGSMIASSPSVKTAATNVIAWELVTFDTDDWDTEVKIRMLNEQDAEYNKISISQLLVLLK